MDDDEEVMLSAIAHYAYCPRRCALVHVEQTFEENVFTLRGSAAHERVDEVSWEARPGARLERALPLWCERLGLTGKADAVEFRDDGTLLPVEFKLGPRKPAKGDELQLCAQAFCLEEMFGKPVPAGAVYHVASKRRRDVAFDASLRTEAEEVIAAVRDLLASGGCPPPANDAHCPNCSLNAVCMPEVALARRHAFLARQLYQPELEGDTLP